MVRAGRRWGFAVRALALAAATGCASTPAASEHGERAGARNGEPAVVAALQASAAEPDAELASVSTAEPAASAQAPAGPPKKRIYSVGQTSWIRKNPLLKESEYLGYVRTGSSIALSSETLIKGQGCPGGFYQVEPRGYVCADRTITEEPRKAFRLAAEATARSTGPFPYRYALSNGAPMYNRIPTRDEQKRFERWHGKPGSHARMPKTLQSHEELAVSETIEPKDKVPSFLEAGGSAKEYPYDLVEQTIPLGTMLSYTLAFEAEGRTWLLSTDHTIVPADRVRPFKPSKFRGVDLTGDVKLPIAWLRSKPRAKLLKSGEAMAPSGAEWPARSWVGLTGKETVIGGKTYLETSEKADAGSIWVASDDATVVTPETTRAHGVKEGQKWFLIRLTQGTLVAYEDLKPVYTTLVSPGAGGVPVPGRDNIKDSTTPTGAYSITFKDRVATMSPEKGKDRKFWIQDVPHTQYFDPPFALHAAYWHERFGDYVSAGCVNLSPLDAEAMFAWSDPAVPEGWQGATGAGAAKENGGTTVVVIRR